MKISEAERIASEVVRQVQAQLPTPLRAAAGQLAVHCAAQPGDEALAEENPEELLGLFVGTPLGETASADLMPAQIYLYWENIWDYADADPGEFRAEVRVTYLHELGHFFGWDENEISRRGLD